MDTLDLIVIVLARHCAASVAGASGSWPELRRGSGWALASSSVPASLPVLGSSEEDPQQLLLVGISILFAGAIIGQVLGLLVGARLRTVIRSEPIVTVDRVGGAAAGAVGVLIAFWLLLPTLAQTPSWPAEQARDSTIADFIHEYFPEPPDTTQALRRVLGPACLRRLRPGAGIGRAAGGKRVDHRVGQPSGAVDGEGGSAGVLAYPGRQWCGHRSWSGRDERACRRGQQAPDRVSPSRRRRARRDRCRV